MIIYVKIVSFISGETTTNYHRLHASLRKYTHQKYTPVKKSTVTSSLKATLGYMPKHAMSGRAYLSSLASGQHSSEETLLRWRAVGDCVDLTRLGIEPQTFRGDNHGYNHSTKRPIIKITLNAHFLAPYSLSIIE